METFSKYPFNLAAEDDIILARGRPENSLGHDKWSEPGPLLTAARFQTGPNQKLFLFTRSHDQSSVTLSWGSQHPNSYENVIYELQQSLSPESGFKTILK